MVQRCPMSTDFFLPNLDRSTKSSSGCYETQVISMIVKVPGCYWDCGVVIAVDSIELSLFCKLMKWVSVCYNHKVSFEDNVGVLTRTRLWYTMNTLKASMLWVWNCDIVGVPLFSWLTSSNTAKKELAVGRPYRWERYEDEEKQFRDELFFTFHVELAPWTGHQLVVETRFELQPDCFCDQAVCHYNSAISPTESLSTFLNSTPQIDHNCHVQWKYAM